MLNKIVICGVGLIGGSFAAALRQAGMVREIVGLGRSLASLQRAQELGLIDVVAGSVEEALRDADLVLLAVPVAQTEALLSQLKPWLQPHTVVTDAGSIKGEVIAAARRALGEQIVQFVPGHPIAGSEQTGPDAALASLYVNRKVVLTPLPENRSTDVMLVEQVWRHCGAEVRIMSAQDHDAVFAAVSHLPHLLAFALVDELAGRANADQLFDYAASGFRDFTRIAGSSPEMWRDIALTNRAAILDELDAYARHLEVLRHALTAADGQALATIFANAQRARQAWSHSIENTEKSSVQNRDV